MTAIHFPFNLQKYRKARNLSQEDLAEKLQVSRQAVAKWEKGANYPDILNLTLLADIFGVTVDALIYGNECTETAGTLPAFPLSSQKLAEFLLIAKKNSYAGNGAEENSPAVPFPMISFMKMRIFYTWIPIWEGQPFQEKKRSGKSSRIKEYRSGQ